ITLPRVLTFRAIARERSAVGVARGGPTQPILTARERQILSWIAAGDSNREIAGRLVISEHTGRAHLRNPMRKPGVRKPAQAVAAAYLTGGEQSNGAARGS